MRAVVIMATILAASPALAALPCMPREQAITELMSRYSEAPLFEGTVKGNGNPVAVMVFANPSTGTWTMMVSPDNTIGCIGMVGEGFKPAKQEPKGNPL